MCGIAGFYGFKNDELIKKFSKELEHRGPDGEAFYIDGPVTLMNRRLAIIDRKGGDQPIFNEDKSIAIVYVGEIYNYQEQREELIRLGHTFRTKSDTEVVIHAYEQWGTKSFDRHNGMFTFALYDVKKKKLLLARDHFGIKPLYFSFIKASSEIISRLNSSHSTGLKHLSLQAGKVSKNFDSALLQCMFSSEIKPLFYSGLIDKKPNERILYRYLKYRIHDDQRETFFEGIYRLMPGEFLTIEGGQLTIEKYTSLEQDLLQLAEESKQKRQNVTKQDIELFRAKLMKAIKYRLISEVPVGSCLSGGLDSSTVVAVVNQLLAKHIKESSSVGKTQNTFSAIFRGRANDEDKYINEVTKFVATGQHPIKAHKVNPKPEEFFAEIEEFIKTQEEPMISTGPYAQYKVMEEAHRFVTVLLDGQGADEMMAGYMPYYFVYLNQLLREKKYLKLFIESVTSLDVLGKYAWIKIANRDLQEKKWMNEKFESKYSKESYVPVAHDLKKRLIEDIFSHSLPSLLRYEDRNAMKFSLEGRVPFLDYDLLRSIFSLPDEAIIKGGWNKYILRTVAKDLLPNVITSRRNKIGFTTPEYDWFMRMKNRIYQIYLSESFANRKYFNQPEVLKAFQDFISGKNDDTMLFWRLINVELWLRIFFDPPPTSKPPTPFVRGDYRPNKNKKLEIGSGGKIYLRYPIRTTLFRKGENYSETIISYLQKFKTEKLKDPKLKEKNYFIVISEKVIAISQGRSYFIWDVRPSFFATLLSKYVTRTPHGIGLGSPWTMQLAINEVGLVRIVAATAVAAITKPLGIKGLFYRIAGREAASIDGPTEYSLYPSNVSAKLGPKNPQRVAEEIKESIVRFLTGSFANNNFLGVVIIDANDLGRNVLGNATPLPNERIEKIFADNPMGQTNEQTPLVMVFEK